MATIESLNFSITRTSFPDGHICSVSYAYYLHIDKEKYHKNVTFNANVVLYGEDLMHDKSLGDSPYDNHTVERNTPQPVHREFVVPCELLDEAWGADSIFLRLYISSSDGEIITKKSATVKDWF